MGTEGTFGDLRRLADACAAPLAANQIARLARRAGPTSIALLSRELAHAETRRRESARDALAALADDATIRPRVIAALRDFVSTALPDEAKVCALGLLSELGERLEVRFSDPAAIQRRSAVALASQLHTPHDVANAVDLMVRQLSGDDIEQMIAILVESAPDVAGRIASELVARLDLASEIRDRIAEAIAIPAIPTSGCVAVAPDPAARKSSRTHTAVLVDAAARLVVIACRKLAGERRHRRWAVLVGATGRIEDCLYEEEPADAAPLIASLCADGYRVASTDPAEARAAIASAARASAVDPKALDSSYYLGRDLLDLADEHLPRAERTPATRDALAATIDRALALLASPERADVERADTLLARAAEASDARTLSVDFHAARGTCALILGRPADAAESLTRAISAEPTWPLHHWNLAIALQQLGDASGQYHALRRFLTASAAPTGLAADPDQPARIAHATATLALLERSSRLYGTSLAKRRRSRKREV
jgi:hypothetical protein